MIKILLSGCNGKMGQVITRLAAKDNNYEIVAGFDINDEVKNSYPVFKSLDRVDLKADAVIDFSNPAAFDHVLSYALRKKVPIVMATTDLSQFQVKALLSASAEIPVFHSANMSVGINLLIDLVKKSAKVLENSFDIEIIEKHHNQKLDAPSGTALAIADAINSVLGMKQEYIFDRHSRRKKRSKSEIGIHAVRAGTIVGEHNVIFAGNDEIIEIKHTALSKDIFGIGALKAALFIQNRKPGLYNMSDLISFNEDNVWAIPNIF